MPFFLTLALGGLLSALVYSVLLAATTGEKHFLLFSFAIGGEVLRAVARMDVLPGPFEVMQEPLRAELVELGTLIATVGFAGFFYTLVPGLRQQRLLFVVFASLVLATVLAQVVALLWSTPAAAHAGNAQVYELLMVGFCMAAVAWRQGHPHAGILALCVGMLWLPEVLRLACALGLLATQQVECFNALWSVLVVIPVLFVGLTKHGQEGHTLLAKEQMESRAKAELFTQMSHELRTPLDTILGNAQLLERRASEPSAIEGLQHIQHSGRHLLHMVDEVLDYARGLAGRLPLQVEPVDWSAWVKQMEHSGHMLAGQRGNSFALEVTGHIGQSLAWDAHRVQQVLDNLIANAARHTQLGWIRLDCSQTDSWLHFAVSDSGEGIAQHDLQRIFLPFERGSGVGRVDGRGLGMGLAIARQLVRSMGGELMVQSEPAKGSRFSFGVQTQTVAKDRAPWFQPTQTLSEPAGSGQRPQSLDASRGLQWARNNVSASSEQQHPRHRVLAGSPCPPVSDLQVLTGFIDSGQVSEILQWASGLRLAHPEYAPFLQEVSGAARDVDFPALRALAASS